MRDRDSPARRHHPAGTAAAASWDAVVASTIFGAPLRAAVEPSPDRTASIPRTNTTSAAKLTMVAPTSRTHGTANSASGFQGIGSGTGSSATGFHGIGRGVASLHIQKPPAVRGKVSAPSSAAEPSERPLADRIKVRHVRGLPNHGRVKRDAITVTLGAVSFLAELQQSPDVGAWVAAPFSARGKAADPLLKRSDILAAALVAVRRDLSHLIASWPPPGRSAARSRK